MREPVGSQTSAAAPSLGGVALTDHHLVSIVTPSLNQGTFIDATINSIKAQTYHRYEHIVVDGGSTDETLGILRRTEGSYPMRWTSEPDRGMYEAVNKGMRELDRRHPLLSRQRRPLPPVDARVCGRGIQAPPRGGIRLRRRPHSRRCVWSAGLLHGPALRPGVNWERWLSASASGVLASVGLGRGRAVR